MIIEFKNKTKKFTSFPIVDEDLCVMHVMCKSDKYMCQNERGWLTSVARVWDDTLELVTSGRGGRVERRMVGTTGRVCLVSIRTRPTVPRDPLPEV